MSSADKAFIETCRDFLDNGTWVRDERVRPHWEDGEPAYTKKKFCVVNRYDLSKEFPLLTLRPISLAKAVDEILWIWQKKSNNIRDLDSHIWDAWADEFDMVDRVLYDLKNNPCSRRIMTNIYTFADLHEMALYPCAYSMTFNVVDGRLCAILNQRSQDMLAANAWNVAQYAALVMMFAQVSGLLPGEFVHVIADAHIYDRHIPIVRELITRESHPAPKVTLDPSITDFYKFTPESFTVENYVHGEKIGRFPVAV